MRRVILFLSALCICSQAVAYNLNYGTGSLPLTPNKKTFPSLAVQIGETVYYGALYAYPAPSNTIRLNVNGTLYWAGEYCQPGTYLTGGHKTCAVCPKDYYCTGGSVGAVACSTVCSGCITDLTGATSSSDCHAGNSSTIAADYSGGIYTWNGSEHGLPNSYNGQTVNNYGSMAYDANLTTNSIYPTYWVQAACSSTVGTYPQQGNPTIANDRYCWCRLKSRSGDINAGFVFQSAKASAALCAIYCPLSCVAYAVDYSDFRSALVGALDCAVGTYSANGHEPCDACSGLGTSGQNPTGGSYSSVSPFSMATDCRYTAPAKTITGCAMVTSIAVPWTGSAWLASMYSVSANAGYYVSGSGTAGATCIICPKDYYCPGGGAEALSCNNVCSGCITDSTGATSSSDCHAGNSSTIAADYTGGIYTWNGSEHGLPCTYNGQMVSDCGSTANVSNAKLTTNGIYPTYWIQAACSSTNGIYPEQGNPVIADDRYCWCRLKRRSDGVNGGFVFRNDGPPAAFCASYCPLACAGYAANWFDFSPALLNAFDNP